MKENFSGILIDHSDWIVNENNQKEPWRMYRNTIHITGTEHIEYDKLKSEFIWKSLNPLPPPICLHLSHFTGSPQ